MNRVMLLGRLVRDPSYNEIKNENGEVQIAGFSIAVRKKNGKGVDYFRVKSFDKQAVFVRDYLKQGTMIAVTGKLVTSSYTDKETGKKITATEIHSDEIEFAGQKNAGGSRENAPEELTNIPEEWMEEMAEEMPFR